MQRKAIIPLGWLRALIFTLLISPISLGGIVIAKKILPQGIVSSIPVLSQNPMQNFILHYSVIAVFCLALLIIFRLFVDRQTLRSLGFKWRGYAVHAWTGFFVSIILLGGGSLVLVAGDYLKFTSINIDTDNLLYGLALFVIVAFTEEIIFRGYILNNLLQSVNKWPALIITSIAFALFHTGNPGTNWLPLVNIFVGGLLFGINYIYTKNLWFSIFLHFSWNFFEGPILGYPVSGFETGSLFTQVLSGPEILTGGDFGFEGSVINLIFTAALVTIFATQYGQIVEKNEKQPA